eukprot:5141506-Prymnesium_polylepis.1
MAGDERGLVRRRSGPRSLRLALPLARTASRALGHRHREQFDQAAHPYRSYGHSDRRQPAYPHRWWCGEARR